MERLTLYKGQRMTRQLDLSALTEPEDPLTDVAVVVTPGDVGLKATATVVSSDRIDLVLQANTADQIYHVELIAMSRAGFHHRYCRRVTLLRPPALDPIVVCVSPGEVRGFRVDYKCRLYENEHLTQVQRPVGLSGFFVSPDIDEKRAVTLVIGAMRNVGPGHRTVELAMATDQGRIFSDKLQVQIGGACG